MTATGGGRIADNIARFARVLRAAGLPLGPASVVDAVQAVEMAGLARREDVYWALHAVFVTRRDHHLIFDAAFDVFWRKRDLVAKMLALMSPVAPPAPRPPEPPKPGAERLSRALDPRRQERQESRSEIEVDARRSMSTREVLAQRDFAQMTAEEMAEARAALSRLILPLDTVVSRRMMAARRGRIDMRRTLRTIVRAGGEMGRLEFRSPRPVRPPVVALVDISGSMSQYSRIFLHFLHVLMERRRHVSVFLFGTRLTNVTRALAAKDPDEALAQVAALVPDWSGGTRIGTALGEFNQRWSRRMMAGGPVVLLITDGLERDHHADLARETERLAKSCRRLVWLNPLLRFEGFEPRAQGIRLMLPKVDEFRPVHNLNSIADLCRSLARG